MNLAKRSEPISSYKVKAKQAELVYKAKQGAGQAPVVQPGLDAALAPGVDTSRCNKHLRERHRPL